jgi:hypothetical protein
MKPKSEKMRMFPAGKNLREGERSLTESGFSTGQTAKPSPASENPALMPPPEKVKLPAHRVGLPGEEFLCSLRPLTPPTRRGLQDAPPVNTLGKREIVDFYRGVAEEIYSLIPGGSASPELCPMRSEPPPVCPAGREELCGTAFMAAGRGLP